MPSIEGKIKRAFEYGVSENEGRSNNERPQQIMPPDLKRAQIGIRPDFS
jgi:hypothetical protein